MGIDTAIINGKLVLPDGIFETAIGIKGEKIALLTEPENLPPADKVIDATGQYVIPGLVDPALSS